MADQNTEQAQASVPAQTTTSAPTDWAAEAAKFGGTVAAPQTASPAPTDWAAEAAKFGGKAVSVTQPTPTIGPPTSAGAGETAFNVLKHVAGIPTNAIGELSEGLDALTDKLSSYTPEGQKEHPVLSWIGQHLKTARGALVGEQTGSTGQPLGTREGLLNNPISIALQIAGSNPEVVLDRASQVAVDAYNATKEGRLVRSIANLPERAGTWLEEFVHPTTPEEAAQRAMKPRPKLAIKAQQDLAGARPYLEESKNLKELQVNAAKGMKEVWKPYKEAIDGLPGDVKVIGPDGSDTVRNLEAKRVKVSAELDDWRSSPAIDQPAKLLKSQKLQELTERMEDIQEAMDPVLRKAGLDPTGIRTTYGQIKGVARTLAGRNTLSENAQRYGLRRVFNVNLARPGENISELQDMASDLLAGRHGRLKPTDVNVAEGFRRQWGEAPAVKPHLKFIGPQAPEGFAAAGADAASGPIAEEAASQVESVHNPEVEAAQAVGSPETFDFGQVLNEKMESGDHFLGNRYTDEGLRKTFDIPNNVSLKHLEQQGFIKFDHTDGAWEIAASSEKTSTAAAEKSARPSAIPATAVKKSEEKPVVPPTVRPSIESKGEKSAAKEVESEPEEADISALLDKAAQEHGVPPAILHAQAHQESKLDPDAVSKKGAQGVMQLMPKTAETLGVDPTDTAQNIDGGTRYLKQLHDRFKHWDQALAAYNWGPGKVQQMIDEYGEDWLEHAPPETQKYVHKILRKAAK